MKKNQAVPVRTGALVVYVFLTVVLLLAGMTYYVISSYYPLDYKDMIVSCAQEYDLDPNLVCAVIATESRFSPEANSSRGAVGLMQIMPETGEWIAQKLKLEDYSQESLVDPETNIRMGTWYLHFLSERFEGDAVIAAYNAGHGSVESWLGDAQYSSDGKILETIPYEETRDYVKKVNFAYEIYKIFYQVG